MISVAFCIEKHLEKSSNWVLVLNYNPKNKTLPSFKKNFGNFSFSEWLSQKRVKHVTN